jgi:pyrroline-5-carboxylate reductase
MMTPILLLGAGRMGGAVLEGWSRAGAFAPADLLIRDPHPSEPALTAGQAGARINPPDSELAQAQTVLLSVKPQLWREVAAQTSSFLAPDAVIVSVAAGVRAQDISHAFAGRPVARVMPTTAAAINQGTASLYAADPAALARAHALFEPLGTVVDLADEGQMHQATAISGSAPGYFYAFAEALEAAGVSAGLPQKDAARLVRSTLIGAAALMAARDDEPQALRRQVSSPGGTTQAALDILLGQPGLQTLLRDAVAAAVRRSKELGA